MGESFPETTVLRLSTVCNFSFSSFSCRCPGENFPHSCFGALLLPLILFLYTLLLILCLQGGQRQHCSYTHTGCPSSPAFFFFFNTWICSIHARVNNADSPFLIMGACPSERKGTNADCKCILHMPGWPLAAAQQCPSPSDSGVSQSPQGLLLIFPGSLSQVFKHNLTLWSSSPDPQQLWQVSYCTPEALPKSERNW